MTKVERAKKVYSEEGFINLIRATVRHYTDIVRRRLNMIYYIAQNPLKLLYSSNDIDVLSDRETIRYLQNNNVGIARYGDGELAYLSGGGTSHEQSSPQLSNQIRKNLIKYDDEKSKKEYVLGLPISVTLDNKFKQRNGSKDYWQYYKKYSMMPLLKKDVIYASPFCFRMDSIDHDDFEGHLKDIQSLFKDKDVIYVSDGKDLQSVDISEHIEIPSENAFEYYNRIRNEIIETATNYDNTLVLLSAGVTATAMSVELNEEGILTYDIGKLYRWL